MAFDFTSSGYVRVANHADIDDLTTGTVIVWLKGDGAGSFLFWKGTQFTAYKEISFRPTGDDMTLFLTRATSSMFYRTNDAPLDITGNVWTMMTFTWESSAGHIYSGTADSVPVESSYAFSDVGSGAFDSDTGGSNGLIVGNRDDFGQPEACPPMGFYGLWNRVMTKAEIISQWDHLHASSGNVIFWLMDRAAATTQPDHSGKGHNATAQTGLTYVTNPPIVSPWDDGDYQLSVSGPAAPAGNATLLQVSQAYHGMRQAC